MIFSNENISYGFSIFKPLPDKANTSDILTEKYLKASEFIKLSARDFSALTGKKLTLFQRLSFKITKMQIRHDLKKNPELKITDYLNKSQSSGSFNLLWFLLGLAGPLLGAFTNTLAPLIILAIAPVIIAYATKQERQKINSVWLGFGSGVLALLIVVLLLLATVRVW